MSHYVRRVRLPLHMNATMFTVAAAAEALGIHRSTVYRAIADGSLHASRFGRAGRFRISQRDLDAWLETGHRPPDIPGGVSHDHVLLSASRDRTVRLLTESNGERRDVEVSPGLWQSNARPLTAEERALYENATHEELEDARALLAVAKDLLFARQLAVLEGMKELIEQAPEKTREENETT
jgi:excisionase family DNA binding protein